MPRREPYAILALALLILIWGTTWAAIRVGLEGMPPFLGVGLRFLLAGTVLWLVARAASVERQGGRRLRALWLIEGGFAFCLSYGVVYWAEQWVSSGLAAVLFSTFPLFVALLAHLWLRDEPLRIQHLAGVALGTAGVVVIFADDLAFDDQRGPLAAAVLLISPFAAAVSHVLVKRWGGGYHPFNIVTVPMLSAGLVMLGLSALVERGRAVDFNTHSVVALLYLAIFGSALTFTLYYWLLAKMSATGLALITYGIPVVAVIVGALAFDEPFTGQTLAGAGCVLLGVSLALRRSA